MAGLGFSFKRICNNQYLIDNMRVNVIDQTSEEPPMVSVTMITYNHEKYISQAIEGVMMQKTNFSIKLIIGEDCSTDATREIVSKFQKKYPDKIILKLPEINLGVNVNSISNKLLCTGKYIAECEGDDFWTDPYKLQKQVDFLEANPEYVICFHPVKILEPNGRLVDDYLIKVPENYESIENLVTHGNYIHTPSVIFRNILKTYPEELLQSPVGDFFLYILLAQHGKIGKLDYVMGVYRNQSGIWSKLDAKERNIKMLFALMLIRNCLQAEYDIILKLEQRISNFFYKLLPNLSIEDLIYLRSNNNTAILTDKLLLNRIKHYHHNQVTNSSFSLLVKTIVKRILKKLSF